MLALLFLYAIARSGFGEAVPMPSIFERSDPLGCSEPIQTRTLWNIIWSCLSTIFICTWGSLHPNISSTPDEPGMGRRDKLRKSLVELLTYKVPLFLWALLVPEYILAWAIRQYITAGAIQKKVPGWTRTHGFFLIMGGFQLYERPDQDLLEREENGVVHYSINPGKFVRILEMDDVRNHKLETIIRGTTEADLEDRGKSDGITKAILILQTLWFIVQCITRGYQHLPLTELEIVTLAYAMMNSFIYIFWWDKPRDVGCPIRIYEDITPRTSYTPRWGSGFSAIVHRVWIYIIGDQDQYVQLDEKPKVPRFWSSRYGFDSGPQILDPGIAGATLGPSIVGMAFGAIHFIAWWHVFPSHTELILWRICCIALVAVPLFSAITFGSLLPKPRGGVLFMISAIAMVLLMLSAWLYIVVRVATIVIAFTALRSLPSDALLVVDWTNFIPHI